MRSKRAHDFDLSKHGFPDVVVSGLDYFCSVHVSFCLVSALLNNAIRTSEKRTKKEMCEQHQCCGGAVAIARLMKREQVYLASYTSGYLEQSNSAISICFKFPVI